MTIDSRWLEILKATGWQTTAIAAACGLFLLFARWGWLPSLPPWVVQIVTFGLLLSGFLTVAAFLSSSPVKEWIAHRITIYRQKRAVQEYIPHMTEQEREIIAYLLAKNQKMFTTAQDGGYAMTLISRGIVVRAIRPGQVFSMNYTPFAIPDHIWSVLMKHKNDLPYHPPPPGENEAPPWVIHWMAR